MPRPYDYNELCLASTHFETIKCQKIFKFFPDSDRCGSISKLFDYFHPRILNDKHCHNLVVSVADDREVC